MNVGELKRAVLLNMNEDISAEALARLGDEILEHLNEAYLNAVLTGEKPVKIKLCEAKNGRIALSELDMDCYEVVRVSNRFGYDMPFYCSNEYIYVESGLCEVEYTFVPKALEEDTDEPILDGAYHYILSDYVTYRMFLKGSRGRQERGAAFLNSYLSGVRKLKKMRYRRIRNKYGGCIYG